jgi:hypothetical protein
MCQEAREQEGVQNNLWPRSSSGLFSPTYFLFTKGGHYFNKVELTMCKNGGLPTGGGREHSEQICKSTKDLGFFCPYLCSVSSWIVVGQAHSNARSSAPHVFK